MKGSQITRVETILFYISEKTQTAFLCVERAIKRYQYTKREFLKSNKSTEILQVIKLRHSFFSYFCKTTKKKYMACRTIEKPK